MKDRTEQALEDIAKYTKRLSQVLDKIERKLSKDPIVKEENDAPSDEDN